MTRPLGSVRLRCGEEKPDVGGGGQRGAGKGLGPGQRTHRGLGTSRRVVSASRTQTLSPPLQVRVEGQQIRCC